MTLPVPSVKRCLKRLEMIQQTSVTLTAAIASGSTEAFATFYRDRFDSLVIRAQAMTRFDEATCLDLVQDTMLKVATSMPRFNDEQQLNAWINRLIINGARDRIRSATRRHRREASRAVPEQAQPTNDDQAASAKAPRRIGRRTSAPLANTLRLWLDAATNRRADWARHQFG